MKEFLAEAVRNRRLMGIALIAAIGSFLFGYDTGVIGGALLFVKQDLNAESNFDQQAIVSVILIGAMVGAFASGYLSKRIGRRATKILSGSIYVIGAIGAALSQEVWHLRPNALFVTQADV